MKIEIDEEELLLNLVDCMFTDGFVLDNPDLYTLSEAIYARLMGWDA